MSLTLFSSMDSICCPSLPVDTWMSFARQVEIFNWLCNPNGKFFSPGDCGRVCVSFLFLPSSAICTEKFLKNSGNLFKYDPAPSGQLKEGGGGRGTWNIFQSLFNLLLKIACLNLYLNICSSIEFFFFLFFFVAAVSHETMMK